MPTHHGSGTNRGGSCLKKMVIGCGCMTVMLCLAIGLLTLMVTTTEPVEPEQSTLRTTEAFGETSESMPLGLPGSVESKKPVKLYIDVSMVEFNIEPTKRPGEIEFEGDYDKANYEFNTHIEEKEDHIAYTVEFKNKRSLMTMLMAGKGEGVDVENKLIMRLPSDILFDLDFSLNTGGAELDLTDVAVRSMDLEMSKGELIVSMSTPNKVPLEKVKVDSEMGKMVLDDIQNLGMTKGRFKGKMGELLIRNSGPLNNDLDLDVDMTMGSARLELPDNVKVESNLKAVFGGVKNTRNDDDLDYPYKVNIKGDATMGDIQVIRYTWRKPVSRALREIIREKGVEEAIKRYYELRETHSDKYNFKPSVLNALGYEYLSRSEYDTAIAVFKLNIEVYPEVANGYDSLGEAYMRAGNKEQAITNYEKSVELDPQNFNGIQMLTRLRHGGIDADEGTPPEPPETPEPPDEH